MAHDKEPVTLRGYVVTYLGLLALATVSLLLALAQVGGLAVALAIGGLKAVGVLWVFMHLAEQRASGRFGILTAATLIAVLVALTALDVDTRVTFPPSVVPPPSAAFYAH
jgi:caa(3)-type oxidase subunit IV